LDASSIALAMGSGRSGQNLPADLIIEMVETIPNLVAVKEASGNLDQMMAIIQGTQDLDRLE
ncbi:dihydrodipicolinate synthase family protein, partial [Citrobacter youngae]|uniref:dihydrodipicolinate synthase family protein n=1 Tax=Citrobacter youngae TaxID=133448 RepID=UPI0019539AEA